MFGKKKKKVEVPEPPMPEEGLPEAEDTSDEPIADDEEDNEVAKLTKKLDELKKKKVKAKEKEEKLEEQEEDVEEELEEATGFKLNQEEMGLAVNALASTEEFKVFQQFMVGQRIAQLIEVYNKAQK